MQLTFEFTGIRQAVARQLLGGVAMDKVGPKKKLLTCLRCDAPESVKKELRPHRRICNECKSPSGKTKRHTWYMDVDLYSIAIKSKTGAW